MSTSWSFENLERLFSSAGNSKRLASGRWGFEKEALRVDKNGNLALSPHPDEFGNKVGNANITTDFSESQVEVITPVLDSINEAYAYLTRLQSHVQDVIGDELLWPLSMPGVLPEDECIPLARYDNSAEGTKREIYREGLARRYGKQMQMISGIHYNFSFGDSFWEPLLEQYGGGANLQAFKDQVYFTMATNFIRYRWLLIYLFGSSPISTDSYKNAYLQQKYNICTHFIEEYKTVDHINEAVSMRMSRFGYENAFQNTLTISHNNLTEYIDDLKKILNTESEVYKKIGVFENGKQIQLNANLLQSENEYYSSVRFKQIRQPKETMLEALENRGILYLELRTFDLDPFEEVGISKEAIHFIHAFLILCLFEEGVKTTDRERCVYAVNAHRVALHGRQPGLSLIGDNEQDIGLPEWGEVIFEKLLKIARLLDSATGNKTYEDSVLAQLEKLNEKALLPSAKITEYIVNHGLSHEAFGLALARDRKNSTRN